jgi:hypothetical protein
MQRGLATASKDGHDQNAVVAAALADIFDRDDARLLRTARWLVDAIK